MEFIRVAGAVVGYAECAALADRRRAMRKRMLWGVVATVCALTAGCNAGQETTPQARGDIEFGIWTWDAANNAHFLATSDVPNVADQPYGWRIQLKESDQPIKWTEVLTLPKAPLSWGGVADNPDVTVSDDGRTATTIGESAPSDGYIDNIWTVARGDPAGIYEISVTLDGGRSAVFRFRLGEPIAAPDDPKTTI